SRPHAQPRGHCAPCSAPRWAAKLQLGRLAEAAAEMRRLQAALDALEAEASAGGGRGGHQRHCSVNKKVAPRHQRLRMPVRRRKFCEINRLAGHGMPYGTVPAGRLHHRLRRISDRPVASLQPTTRPVKGGHPVPPSASRRCWRCRSSAAPAASPIVYLSEIFPDAQHGGRTFLQRGDAERARRVAQLALVLGSSTAGGAYVADHVRPGGHGGPHRPRLPGRPPPLVQAALGEVVSADELGGAALHSHTSGCSDHFAGDEAEGFRLMREIAGTLPRPPPPPPAEPPADRSSASTCCRGRARRAANRPAEHPGRLLDSSQLLEFKPTFSHGLVCGFGRICGRTVGLMGSWTRLGEKDAVKGAHFLELCGHRGLPLVSLVHTEPDLPEPAGSEALAESAAPACLRAKARMMALSAAFPLPRLSLIVGDAAGCGDYFLMVRRAGDPRWNSWGVATLMAEEPLQIDAQKMFSRRATAPHTESNPEPTGRPLRMSPDFLLAWPNGRLSERLDAAEPGADAFKAAGQLWIDDVIRPAETRLQLDRLLRLSLHYSGLPVHSAG
uniref:Carboxyl_trans domain-containing protein n=1 Tax=Macrostomum lignano TaxID=282301 RepID=A0A1I8FQV2_9PLAT